MSTIANASMNYSRGLQFDIPNQIDLFSLPMSFVKSGGTHSHNRDEDTGHYVFYDDGYSVKLWNDFINNDDKDTFFSIEDNIAFACFPIKSTFGYDVMLPIRCIAR